MRKIDLKAARPVLLELRNGKQTLKVYKPTLRQLLDHENLRAAMLTEAAKARDKDDYRSVTKIQMDYLIDEIGVFVPGISWDDILDLTEDQRLEIMRAVRPELYEEENSSDGPPQKA